MGGATIFCGKFEGNDKAGSPISSVLDKAFLSAFSAKRRGKIFRRVARFFGRSYTPEQEMVELAILGIMYDEEGKFTSEVAKILLPYLQSYQMTLLGQCKIQNEPDAIQAILAPGIGAKYGKHIDPGWHLYCLHDLVIACEKSIVSGEPVQVIWS